MLFDSHAHFDDKRFNEDRDEILSNINNDGISNIMNIGSDMPSSRRSIILAQRYSFIYAAIGVHPHDVKAMSEADIAELHELSTDSNVVAIGEIGLDYYYDNSPRDLQKIWFTKQMDLAMELKLPVIIHNRDATADCIDILKRYDLKKYSGVMHCFSGSVEVARDIIKMGMYISIAGPITYKNAHKAVEVVDVIPLENILIETDCPYLSPVPHRGERNDSRYVRYVAEKISEIKGVSIDEVAKITSDNAKRLFNIV